MTVRLELTLAALAISGCVFDTSTPLSADGTDGAAPDARPLALDAAALEDANPTAPDAASDPDAMPSPPLDDTGLIVRYFMDEAASGQTPAFLVDTASTPLPLPITYGQASFVEENGNRGLRWPTLESSGKAQVAFGGTKLITQLSPSATVTIEVVVDIDNAGTGNDQSQIAGLRGGNPDFMLAADGNDTIHFYRPFGNLGATWAGVHSQERMVLHLIYNANDATPENRIVLYKDGVEIPKTTSSPPSLGRTVGLGGSDSLLIGNSPNQDRSLSGAIYYVAMYNVALSPAAVANNSKRLLDNDDQ